MVPSVKSTIINRHAHKKYVFCALCGIKREFAGHRFLTKKMWARVLAIGSFLSLLTYPLLGWNCLLSLVMVAIMYEFTNMSIYRKEVKCPHCGFDPIWYRKNWRLAKTMIQKTVDAKKLEIKSQKS